MESLKKYSTDTEEGKKREKQEQRTDGTNRKQVARQIKLSHVKNSIKSDLNRPTERQKLSYWIKKARSNYVLSTINTF